MATKVILVAINISEKILSQSHYLIISQKPPLSGPTRRRYLFRIALILLPIAVILIPIVLILIYFKITQITLETTMTIHITTPIHIHTCIHIQHQIQIHIVINHIQTCKILIHHINISNTNNHRNSILLFSKQILIIQIH